MRPKSPVQLPLNLVVQPRHGLDDFMVGPSNEAAYDMIRLWPDWPDRFLILQGPEGSGKTHLAAIWSEMSGAQVLSGENLSTADAAQMTAAGNIVIEDADRGAIDEKLLFHLLNLVRERSVFLLMTARRAPESWGIRTPDLASRLRLAPLAGIEAPDDALLRALIVKHFVDRQLIVDTSVVEFIMTRIERSFASAARVVAELDREALSLGRRITRTVAAQVVERLANGAP